MPSYLQLITENGVTREILLILIYIPVIATIINFARYVIGLRMLGIYPPMVLAFGYLFIGIRYGVLVTIAVIVATMISYSLLKRFRMHYMSRITINYTFVAAFVLLVLVLHDLSPVKLTTALHNPNDINPLGIILIATLSDFFIEHYVKKSFQSSIRALAETILVALAGWAFMRIPDASLFLLRNIWIIPILLVVNLGLGRYIGFRVTDYLRFKKITQDE